MNERVLNPRVGDVRLVRVVLGSPDTFPYLKPTREFVGTLHVTYADGETIRWYFETPLAVKYRTRIGRPITYERWAKIMADCRIIHE